MSTRQAPSQDRCASPRRLSKLSITLTFRPAALKRRLFGHAGIQRLDLREALS